MTSGSFRFDAFALDTENRTLSRDGVPVTLNGRYFDALVLLVREQGKLVSKDRFLDEVWRGVPVTDEALTQCIRILRRQLGDDAARPRFIETVPKHGYRFIAQAVEQQNAPLAAVHPSAPLQLGRDWRRFFLLGCAGAAGGGLAGLAGGLFYGFASAAQPMSNGPGAASVLLVVLCLTLFVALIGAAGVAFGIAAAGLIRSREDAWSIFGGAGGGLVVGAVVKLLGLDAFNLLLGQAPQGITGAGEGALLGAAVGLGAWLAVRARSSYRRAIAFAATSGAAGGLLVTAFGGRLMAGSLDLLARTFPASRLRLNPFGAFIGERSFGPVSQVATNMLEGALFAACIVGAMLAVKCRQAEDE